MKKGRGGTAQLAHVVAREDGNNHWKYYEVILIESPPIYAQNDHFFRMQ
jgi:hypothetical protein